MKSLTLLFLIVTLVFFLVLSQTASWAVDETPTPTESQDVLGDKVKEIRDAVKERVRETLNEAKQGQKRAFVGEITEISDGMVSLKTRSGLGYTAVTADTTVLGLNRQPTDPSELTVGNFAIAMGFTDENSVLQAKRLLVIAKPAPRLRRAIFGTVSDISQTENMLTVKNVKAGTIYSVEASSQTTITKKVNGKMETVEFEAIKINDRIVAVGKAEENSEIIISATRIHVIPGLALGQTEPTEATPSPAE